mgnify:CR=1 FL=1
MVFIDFGPYHICGYRLVPPLHVLKEENTLVSIASVVK